MDRTNEYPVRLSVAFVGLGRLGCPMALSLVRVGFVTSVYDLSRAAMDRLAAAGARAADSLSDLVAEADVVCVCVRYDDEVRDVILGPGGVLRCARRKPVVVVHSTVLPTTLEELAKALAAVGLDLVDAPVSGGARLAKDGELTVMVAGPASALARVQPLFDAVGGRTIRVGTAPGEAQVVKLANNAMMYANQLAILEATAFAEAHGIPAATVREVARVSSGGSWTLEHWDEVESMAPTAPTSRPASPTRKVGKDLQLIIQQARAEAIPMPFIDLAARLVQPAFDDYWAMATQHELKAEGHHGPRRL